MKKKFNLKDYLPVLLMLLCAAVIAALTATGKLNIKDIPRIVEKKPGAAFLVFMALFVLKGISGVILYDALLLMIAAFFRFPFSIFAILAGTAINLSVPYLIGRRTNTEKLNELLSQNPKVAKYLDISKEYGATASAILHMLGLNIEVLGVLFGALRISFPAYLVSSVVGLAPCICSMLVIGDQPDVHTVRFWLMIALYAGCAVLALLYAKHLSGRKKGDSE